MAYHNMNRGSSVAHALVKAIIIGWLITISSAAIIAFLLHTELIGETVVKPAAVTILALSAFVTTSLIGKRCDGKRLLFCTAGGGIYFLSLMGCNWMLYGGHYNGLLGALLIILGCSLVATLLHSRQKQQRPTYMKKLPKA